MKTDFERLRRQPGIIMAVNMLLMLVIYMLMRWVFYWMNIDTFRDVTFTEMMTISWGGLRFDISALCYLNAICILLQFLPIKQRHTVKYQKAVKIIFLVINILGIAVNAADIVYFEFGGRRTTSSIFSEFGGESNLFTIFLNSITGYWKVWVFGVAMITAAIFLYYNPVTTNRAKGDYPRNGIYYPVHATIFVIALMLTLGGLRGGFGLKMHPLRQDSADIYCKKPIEAAIVLNTPFTLLTTIHKTGYKDPHFFPKEELDGIFNPIHNPSTTAAGEMKKLNVVVFIMESFSMEFTGFFNRDRDGGKYTGYTPFLYSLMQNSYTFQYAFANGIRSVDCMPACFAGIPRYINPYCYFFYSNNTLQGLPAMLRNEGYTTAFFHGAPNNTLGFKGFTNAIGFEQYFGKDEYGPGDFDGTWAIFDEPYLKYFADKTNQIAQGGKPFFLTVFTATSHDPFPLPDEYKHTFNSGPTPMHNVVSYTDHAIKQYFQRVSGQPWLNNTIFVFTADHCGKSYRQDYNNDMGRFLIPIFFYTPGRQLPAKCDSTTLIQQTDITPTLLALLNYQKPCFAFGKNVFDDNPDQLNFVFNDRDGTSMYYLDSLMIQYRDSRLTGIYRFKNDPSLQHNLLPQRHRFPQLPRMQRQIEAIIQQYVTRMQDNNLTTNPRRRTTPATKVGVTK